MTPDKMTPTEVDHLLAEMTSLWFQKPVAAQTIAVFRNKLKLFNFETARAAIHELADNEDWFPTIHQFSEAYKSLRRRQELAEHKPALPPGAHNDRVAVAWMDEIGEQIKQNGKGPSGSNVHLEHKDWDSCAECINRNQRVLERVNA